jgi:hypothetical protein
MAAACAAVILAVSNTGLRIASNSAVSILLESFPPVAFFQRYAEVEHGEFPVELLVGWHLFL